VQAQFLEGVSDQEVHGSRGDTLAAVIGENRPRQLTVAATDLPDLNRADDPRSVLNQEADDVGCDPLVEMLPGRVDIASSARAQNDLTIVKDRQRRKGHKCTLGERSAYPVSCSPRPAGFSS
jgi:hypothetical protein